MPVAPPARPSALIIAGLDIYSLSELALSADGKRLVVTNSRDAAVAKQDGGGIGAGRDAAAAGSPAAGVNSSGSPSSAARGGPPQGLLGGQNAQSRVAVSSSSPSSSAVPLVPRRHMTQLLRSLGIDGGEEAGGGGEVGTVASAAARAEKVRERERERER